MSRLRAALAVSTVLACLFVFSTSCSPSGEECCPDEEPEEGASCSGNCGSCSYDSPACPEAIPIYSCRGGEWEQTGHADQLACGDADSGAGDVRSDVREPRDVQDTDQSRDSADSSPDGDTGDTSSPEDSAGDALDVSEACGPVHENVDGEYYEVLGDVEKRRPCNEVCSDVCLTCDGEYDHFEFDQVAHIARYGPEGAGSGVDTVSSDCGARPEATEVDFSGDERDLREYSCYCRPPR